MAGPDRLPGLARSVAPVAVWVAELAPVVERSAAAREPAPAAPAVNTGKAAEAAVDNKAALGLHPAGRRLPKAVAAQRQAGR